MTFALSSGWAFAVAAIGWALLLRRRLGLVADSAHELRGPAAALTLAVASLRREPGGIRRARALEAQIERMRAGLADLDAARCGRRATVRPAVLPVERLVRSAAAGRRLRVRWDAGAALVRIDRGRFAQLLGNLVDNAFEHGSGRVELSARRDGDDLRIELRNDSRGPGRPARGRGRGLAIAGRAASGAGGTLAVEHTDDATTAVVDLPLADS